MNDLLSDEARFSTVLIRIRATLPELRPSERRVAQFFLDNPAASSNLSIVELAKSCMTSTASVVRFYQRIGYAHYQDLRLDLAKEALRERLTTSNLPDLSGDIAQDDTLQDVVAKVAMNETLSIADTARTLDINDLARAIDLVSKARRVDSFGIGASSFVGLDLQQKLSRIGRTALNWTDSHAAWTAGATLDSSCVAIAISHTGTTLDTIEYLSISQASGAATIAITNFPESALASKANVVLTTAARETRFRAGALGSRIAQLMIVDCLFTGIAQSSYEASIEALRRTYLAVNERRRVGNS